MRSFPPRPCVLALVALACCVCGRTFAKDLENDLYRVRLAGDGSVEVSRKDAAGVARVFHPEFTLLSRQDDPGYVLGRNQNPRYRLPAWKAATGEGETDDLFKAASRTTLTAAGAEPTDAGIAWRFADHAEVSVGAVLELPPGRQEPKVTFRFTPKRAGWYSLGYTGAPEVAPEKLQSLWQPLIWQERRFPARSWLSMESTCPLPAVLAQPEGGTYGVAADPAEIPFRLPNHRNSRFGVLLRNETGRARPMIFAPVLGGEGSRLDAGAACSFGFRIVLHPGDTLDTFESLARGLYGFRDYRENVACSLNRTLENMVDYALNDEFSGWNADLRGSDYSTDVVGSVKNVSALHPLSIALVTDNEAIYHRRVLPMIEYLMSREKYLFSPDERVKAQSTSSRMKGPAAEVSELAALHDMFRGRTHVFRHYALGLFDKQRALNLDMVSEGGSWQNALAVYRLTGDKAFLDKATAGADDYVARRIDTPQTDLADVRFETGGQFWTDFAPKWTDLYELYEATGNERYLKASLRGVRLFTQYVWMQPCVPDGNVVVNKGGLAPLYYKHRTIRGPEPLRAPEQSVPAWRVSQVGLMPEASTTYPVNPAVFLAHHAPYMLRMARATGDTFLHDIARSAVVGRYTNFPGYDINGEYTTVYERPDYPLRRWRDMTYNQVYYNHVWPMIALTMDYLVSDACTRSAGKIDFPSRYAQGYAYLQSKVYGDRPGTFYGDADVRLWMPRQLLDTDNVQANYVAGYGNDSFYVALVNQSKRPQDVTVTLNPNVVPVDVGRTYDVMVWRDNEPAEPVKMRDGRATVSLSPGGITALKVPGVKVTTQFQDQVLGTEPRALPEESIAVRESPFGNVTGMLISMGDRLTSAYVWLEATPAQVRSATLHYRSGKAVRTVVDASYPFEFSVPLPADGSAFESWVEATPPDGPAVRSEPVQLRR